MSKIPYLASLKKQVLGPILFPFTYPLSSWGEFFLINFQSGHTKESGWALSHLPQVGTKKIYCIKDVALLHKKIGGTIVENIF